MQDSLIKHTYFFDSRILRNFLLREIAKILKKVFRF